MSSLVFYSHEYFFLAVLSGLCFALMGVAYRLGQLRHVPPVALVLVCSVAGFLYFAGKSHWALIQETPFHVWGWAVFCAAGNYLGAKVFYYALQRGPLSPIWCAANLSFVLVIIYAMVVFKEDLTLYHLAALVCAIGCVVIASRGQTPVAQPTSRSGPCPALCRRGSFWGSSIRLEYGLLLLLILVCNGTGSLALKCLNMVSSGQNDMIRYGTVFFLAWYGLTAGLIGIDMLIHRKNLPPFAWTLGLGLLMAVGSIGGLLSVSAASRLAPAMVFAVSSVVSIMVVAVISVIALGEKPTLAWLGTVGLGVFAVLLVSMGHQ